MKIILLPTPEYGCSTSGLDEVYSEHTLTDYAFACVEADRLKRDEWKEAVLDALSATHMDAEICSTPADILARITDWHFDVGAASERSIADYYNEPTGYPVI